MIWKINRQWSAMAAGYLLLILLGGCGYSFTSGTIHPDIKTISIYNFTNESGSGPPYLQQRFTERLREYYQSNTKLVLVNSGGDMELEGFISRYEVKPVAAQQNQTAGLNRLTIAVKVKFTNNKKESIQGPSPDSFAEMEFSFFDDLEQNQSLSQAESESIEIIFPQIVQDIFNKTTSSW